jgi:4-carboxymuconolactone decarboxylase
MGDARLSALAAGEWPSDPTEAEAGALDVVSSLLRGGVLPQRVYDNALTLFGQAGTRQLIWLVGHYCAISVTLNGFAIQVPDGVAGL